MSLVLCARCRGELCSTTLLLYCSMRTLPWRACFAQGMHYYSMRTHRVGMHCYSMRTLPWRACFAQRRSNREVPHVRALAELKRVVALTKPATTGASQQIAESIVAAEGELEQVG